jgi:glycosyltransferase involved in cell wall biosynthesis
LLAESNALLFPSIIEGFGLVMLESWQQNRPVVTSDIPPMSDIVEHNKTGIVVDPHDENKWADVIIQLIQNPGFSDEMGKVGNIELKTKYNEKLFSERIIKMYKDISN